MYNYRYKFWEQDLRWSWRNCWPNWMAQNDQF